MDSPSVQEYEPHVERGPEHEHVGVQLELGDGGGRQRVPDRHQPQRRRRLAEAARAQVARAVDHLCDKVFTFKLLVSRIFPHILSLNSLRLLCWARKSKLKVT